MNVANMQVSQRDTSSRCDISMISGRSRFDLPPKSVSEAPVKDERIEELLQIYRDNKIHTKVGGPVEEQGESINYMSQSARNILKV